MSLEKGFIEAIKEATKEGKTAFDTVARVARVKDGTAWVHIDGGVDETPAELTINANKGDTVRLRISGGKAYLIGNRSDPPASGQALLFVGKNTQEVVDILKANNISAKTAVVEHLEANDALINILKLNKLDVSLANITNATIENLKAGNAEVQGLNAFYANIDGANISEAFIGQVFNKNAMIEDAIVTTLDATGRITAVRINADYINANTLKANRIIFLGTDGLFHQLNETGETSLPDQTDNNSLNGSVITASSITADKLTVTDLSAFGADIAGLKLEDSSIHTYGKDNPYSTVEGWYIGTADGAGGIQDNNGDIFLSNDGRDFDASSERYNGFTIGNAEEYMRFAGGVLEIRSRDLDSNFLKRSEYLTQNNYTFGSRAPGSAVGMRSVVEGQDNIASGSSSHAEGLETEASGDLSHSEGERTEATGAGSHAEGAITEASGNYSHAEGYNSEAAGDSSHAEGYFTKATGTYSHAEGRETEATGRASHAGGYNTKASSHCQTVIGRFNEEDIYSRYAFIIGGGNPTFLPFDEVDWQGINLKGLRIKVNAGSHCLPIGTGSDWIMKSTGNVTKLLYQVDEEEEPAGSPGWTQPAYRYAPDDCEVHETMIGNELIGAETSHDTEEVVWNPNTDFIVSEVNTNHPLFPYLGISSTTGRKNILAVDWDGNIHIPSASRVIADL